MNFAAVKDGQSFAPRRKHRHGTGTRAHGFRPEELLRCETAQPAWAVFDPDWYLGAYPAVHQLLSDRSRCGVLDFYLERGQRLGHSPNMFFDEIWYRSANPDTPNLIAAGEFVSGFHHYCAVGYPDRSPHWLYDDTLYRQLNPEVAVPGPGFVNRYDHYLQQGGREKRRAHVLFDADYYQERMHDPEIDEIGTFVHFLRLVHLAGCEAETSVYFDAAWYRYRYPAVDHAIRAGRWLCALHHYTCNDSPADFDPLCQFSERFYREANADILPELAAGILRSAYQHFLFHGVFEQRRPAPWCDLGEWQPPREAGASGEATRRSAFAWMLRESREAEPPAPPSEPAARALFQLKARDLLAQLGRQGLDFSCDRPPEVAVIMVVRNCFALTMLALASLRANHAGAIELVLVDSGSTDETRSIEQYVTGAKLVRFESNVGFVHGCNAALAQVSAAAVLFLNNDVELAPGCLAAALRRLGSDNRIGAVGGKVVRTHGLLQEAGSIVWRDGSASGYARDATASAPEANFVRNVDFCSGVFLLVRVDVLAAIGGFDEAFAPAYYEDVDFCVRLWRAGYRIVYDPAVQLTHYEYASSRSDQAAVALMEGNRRMFAAKHASWLKHRYARGGNAEVFARSAHSAGKRILFIEDTIPLRCAGSGYVRANDIVHAMVTLGSQVTVFPLNPCPFELIRMYKDFPDTVEVMHDRALEHLPEFLESRAGYYDLIWVSRAHNLDKARAALERSCPDANRATIVLDTEAVFSVRELARAKLTGTAFDLDRALGREFANAWLCQRVVAVSAAEAEILRSRVHLGEVAVLGTMREPTPTPRPFEGRSGLLFVGSMHQAESPNYDALCWFADEVLPKLTECLGSAARLTVAGYTSPQVRLQRWRNRPDIELLGEVADLAPLYDRHRVFVAPTRYAAGTPYKVYEAAGYGLPAVVSELLRKQLGWRDGIELLAADPADSALFAERIASLYRSRELWHTIRSHAASRLARENSQAGFFAALRAILTPERSAAEPSRQPAPPRPRPRIAA